MWAPHFCVRLPVCPPCDVLPLRVRLVLPTHYKRTPFVASRETRWGAYPPLRWPLRIYDRCAARTERASLTAILAAGVC